MAKGTGGDIPEEFRVAGGTPSSDRPETGGLGGSGSGNSSVTGSIDPAQIGDGGGNRPEEVRRKRGRPKGASKATEETKAFHLSNLNFVILNAHLLLSRAVNSPELAIDAEEADTLASATKEVLKHYNVGMTDKQAAWTNLVMVSTAIYGGRVYRISERKAKERAEKIKLRTEADNVGVSGLGGV